MRRLKAQVYLTADQLDERVKEREALANSMPAGATKQSILTEVIGLRSYANMKRLLALPERKAK